MSKILKGHVKIETSLKRLKSPKEKLTMYGKRHNTSFYF